MHLACQSFVQYSDSAGQEPRLKPWRELHHSVELCHILLLLKHKPLSVDISGSTLCMIWLSRHTKGINCLHKPQILWKITISLKNSLAKRGALPYMYHGHSTFKVLFISIVACVGECGGQRTTSGAGVLLSLWVLETKLKLRAHPASSLTTEPSRLPSEYCEYLSSSSTARL